jgi:hypothetical protein
MKTTFLALMILFTSAAFAQNVAGGGAILNSQPQELNIPSHELHAMQQPLAEEKSILFTSSNLTARGERPLWEAAGQPAPQASLGEVARMYRDQHAVARKAVKTLEKQGSK